MALAQSNMILAECRANFPSGLFELKIIKTTGDKMQTLSLANPNQESTKGLFTKELEMALLNGEADLAVHSLKDLPTELPDGLTLGAVGKRADVRDVLIYRDARVNKAEVDSSAKRGRQLQPNAAIDDFPTGATIATSSVRRQAQLLALRPDLNLVPIRGNVGTRLQKLIDQPELDGLILAAAGLSRLHMEIDADGTLHGDAVPPGLLAVYLAPELMLPCVGQGALGIEVRAGDSRIAAICERLNDLDTERCVVAERAFLHAMGGGCLSPVAAYADLIDGQIRLRAVSFRTGARRTGQAHGAVEDAERLGRDLAGQLGS